MKNLITIDEKNHKKTELFIYIIKYKIKQYKTLSQNSSILIIYINSIIDTNLFFEFENYKYEIDEVLNEDKMINTIQINVCVLVKIPKSYKTLDAN